MKTLRLRRPSQRHPVRLGIALRLNERHQPPYMSWPFNCGLEEKVFLLEQFQLEVILWIGSNYGFSRVFNEQSDSLIANGS